jgi:hypothetical protein
MSLAAIPKPAGVRPPNLPPISTTFDSSPDGPGDPVHIRIAESVDFLIRSLDATPDEGLNTVLELLHQRKRWIEGEMDAARMLEHATLPPPILGLHQMDDLITWEDELTPFYQRLINRLDDAIRHVRARMWVLKQDVFTSER